MKFSIITVNYNNKEGLRNTIESVINQTFNNYEFIIIDGGSDDGSVELIKEYNCQISYWESKKDNGIYHAMNKGIHKATGDYLNFMNSGDCFYNNTVLQRISQQIMDIDILVGKDYHYNNNTHKGFSTILPPRLSMLTFYVQTLPHQSTFFKKSLFNNSLYDEGLHLVSDFKFYIQKICIENCSTKYTEEIVCKRENDGLSTQMNELRLHEREKVLSHYLPAGIMKDYDTLSKIDTSSLYKLMHLCETSATRRILTLCIKIINKLWKLYTCWH